MSYVWDGFNIQNSTHFFYYLSGTMYIIPRFLQRYDLDSSNKSPNFVTYSQ